MSARAHEDVAETTEAPAATQPSLPASPTKKTPRAPKPLPTPAPDRLVAQLVAAAGPATSHPVQVPLSAVATGVAMLGSGPVGPLFLRHLAEADPGAAVAELRGLWREMEAAFPFLSGHLDPLLGWLSRDVPEPEDVAGFQKCAGVLAGVDLYAVASRPPVGGELLGPVYTLLRNQSGKKAAGAFFTPMAVASTLTMCMELAEGETFAEPCSGAGVMAVAAAKSLRARGGDPATVRWVLNDIDPVAVALSGVNAAVHGFGQQVVLSCGDGLSLGEPAPEERRRAG